MSKGKSARHHSVMAKERLRSAAIRCQESMVISAFQGGSHSQLRRDYQLVESDPDNEDGFVTSTDRFVTREEAVAIGVASGQLSPMWEKAQRKLLSSDINW